MKRCHLSIFVLFLLLFTAYSGSIAGPPSYTTAGVFNGRMWQLLSDAQKISHLTGIQDGIILCLNQIKADLNIPQDLMKRMQDAGVLDRRRMMLSSQGITAVERRINAFYGESENIEIPITEAYRHVTMALNFADPRDVADNLSTLKRKYGK